MPIDYHIDRKKKIVFTTPKVSLTHEEMVAFQQDVWARPGLRGFDELIDMSQVADVRFQSPQDVMRFAELSAGMDDPKRRTKTAIITADKLYNALGRMYQAYRAQSPGSNREVEIFRDMNEAMDWLRPRKKPRGRSAPAHPVERR